MLVKDCVSKFLLNILITRTSDTYKYYKYHCVSILDYFSSMELDDIIYDNISSYVLLLHNKGLSNNTINKRIGILKTLNTEYGFNSTIVKFPKLKIRQKTFDFLSFNEVKKLIEYVHTLPIENELIFRLFLDTGIRLNELLNIDYRNIDFENCCILLTQTKTNVDRYVFMTEYTCDLLRAYYLSYCMDCKDYFLFHYAKRTIQDWFYKANKVLGFKHFSPHVLRHTYATILVNNDTNLEFIRITMGHSNLNTTKRYLHMNLENFMNIYKEKFHA